MIHYSNGIGTVRPSSFSIIKGCWLMLVMGIALGMVYLWIHSRVVDVAWKLESLEDTFSQLQSRHAALGNRLAKLQTPAVIKARLEEEKIELDTPQPDQIVRVYREGGGSARKLMIVVRPGISSF